MVGRAGRVDGGVTDPGDSPADKLTTDPPRPPGTPDVDELVGDPVPAAERRTRPDDEDVPDADEVGDTVSVEPSD